MSDLKPCPFCGDNRAYIVTAFDSTWERICCAECGVLTGLFCRSENNQRVRDAWNTRAADTIPRAWWEELKAKIKGAPDTLWVTEFTTVLEEMQEIESREKRNE